MKNEVIEAAIAIAFEAGRWAGQVDLEEHFDREQYTNSMREVYAARKTAMPVQSASVGRTVTINLRSEEWRVGVKKQVSELLEKARELASKAQNEVV